MAQTGSDRHTRRFNLVAGSIFATDFIHIAKTEISRIQLLVREMFRFIVT